MISLLLHETGHEAGNCKFFIETTFNLDQPKCTCNMPGACEVTEAEYQ